ncbi:MAG: nitrite/sulfite reductase [Campylobacterales bacterium]|nr:nitrite/sulfite reductase [Campylobacterales bacterium]
MNIVEKKLNKRERYKAKMIPYDYYPQIETLDFSALSEADIFYLQDFGIFNNPLNEEDFTLRLRITAGRISVQQLHSIAHIAKSHSLDIILTARAGIQLHGLTSENVLSVFHQINATGITTWQTFGDNVRNIVTDVYDGLGETCEIEVYPLIVEMEQTILKIPRQVGMLPRRISTGISGNRANVTSFFANDLYFGLAQKDGVFGFNVYMGGKNTEIARCANIFLLTDEVVAFFSAFIEAFNKHGLRNTRSQIRLFYLLETIGIEMFKEYIAHEYQKTWQTAGTLILEKREFSKSEKLQDGSYAFCYESDFGRVTPDELTRIATFAHINEAEVRLTTQQNIVILGLLEKTIPFENLPKSATVIVCAGSSYCPFSFWDLKNEALLLPLDKIQKHRIQVGVSGCAKGCGRHQHCDIGLIGLRTSSFGDVDKAARIYFGAQHSNGISVGRELFTMVPLEHIGNVIEMIIDEYEASEQESFEDFSTHVLNHYSEEFCALWFLAKLDTGSKMMLHSLDNTHFYKISFCRFDAERKLLEESFSGESFLSLIDNNFENAIRSLSKKLWTIGQADQNLSPQIKKLMTSKKYWEL